MRPSEPITTQAYGAGGGPRSASAKASRRRSSASLSRAT